MLALKVKPKARGAWADGFIHGLAIADAATCRMERCGVRRCRIAVALNSSAVVRVSQSVLGDDMSTLRARVRVCVCVRVRVRVCVRARAGGRVCFCRLVFRARR